MPKHHALVIKSAQAARAACVLLALLCCCSVARAQKSEAPASVTGRVREGERGVAGITVTLMASDPAQRFKTIARAKTDAEGRFRLTNIAPGRYQIQPFAPVYVVQGLSTDWPPGKFLTLLAGEEVSDIDFNVEHGGVITGRVTDADGNPVIAERVSIETDNNTQFQRRMVFDQRDQMTDDRGVYRIYGLPAGRYRVSVGQSDEMGAVTFGRRKIYKRTFYPDATEAAQARLIEVKPGSEATDIDITLGRAVKTYRASGRFVSSETGQPVPNVVYGYGALDPGGRRISFFGSGMTTNARGEFQTEGLAPGRYAVFTTPQEGSEFYSDAVNFEVTDADVTGVVVRLKRGASVSGFVTIEGASDRALVARLLTQVRVYGFVDASAQSPAPNYSRPPVIGADGSFRLAGLRPGKLRISSSSERAKGVSFSRVELNGVPVTNGIDIAEGAQLTGVRVVLAYGSAVIHGQINFTNGVLPPNSRVLALLRRVGAVAESTGGRQVAADSRGLFIIDSLPAGEYELTVRVFGPRAFQSEPQRISLADGGEMSVTPVIDLNAPPRGGRP